MAGRTPRAASAAREYDAVSGVYAQFVEREVLPLVEKNADVKLTKNPDGRATMGLSSSGVAAFTMAWFYPDLYHRVLAFSPTMVNQQWPHDPSLRGGAWEYHSAWTGPATPNLISKAGVLTPAEPPGVPLIRPRRRSRSVSGSSAATRTCSIRTPPFPMACTTGPSRTR